MSKRTTSAAPNKSTTVRTLRIVGAGIRVCAAFAPRRAEQLLIRLFSTPRNSSASRRLPADAHLAYIPFEGGELAVWSLGSGPTVLLAHGWAGTGDDLLPLAGVLRRAGYRAVCFDMPAHGRSTGRRTNLLQMARAIRAVAGHLGASDDLVLAGHSLGGAAVTLALRDGLRARAAVLLSAPAAASVYFQRMTSMLGLPTDLADSALRALAEVAGGDLRNVHAADAARRLTLPALVVHDRRDREVPWEDGRAIVAAWKGARLLTTEGLGHRRILSDGGVLETILDFITHPHEAPSIAVRPARRESRELIAV